MRFFNLTCIIAALSMICSCSEQNSIPEYIEPDPVPVRNAKLTFTGGRERILCQWSGIPSAIAIMRVMLDGNDLYYDIPVEHSSGKKYMNDVPEGKYEIKVSYISDEGAVTENGNSYSVECLGTEYEKTLEIRKISSKELSGARAEINLEEFNRENYIGEKYSYRDVYGNRVDTIINNSYVKFQNVGGTITHRSTYSIEGLADVFYSPADTIHNSVLVRPSQYNTSVEGYRGIWFDLGQAASSYGSKYSGGLGTYTMKHIPMAVYSPAVDRTFFVYGGTSDLDKKYLLCMVGCYDHKTGMLQKPRIVMDKGKDGVIDPHDDPTIQIDKDGYIWVFVSGRGNKRPGKRYRSVNPYDITAFNYVNESIMAYPQVMYSEEKGFFLFFTRYDGTRQLFYQSSEDGVNWTPYKQLASIKETGESNSGHYQISNLCGTKLCTAFNRHINGNVDTRTNIYYVQSTDWGQTWTTADGTPVTVPVTDRWSNCLVRDYQSTTETHNCYIKDLNFDTEGNPVILYLTSKNHLTGPDGGTRQWHVIHWTGKDWDETLLTTSTHCYDSGSLWIDGDEWTVIAPTNPGPQYWGTGGEVVMWKTTDKGKNWKKVMDMTSNSTNNQSYMRRPWYASDGFYSFWADGNPDKFTQSYLYFCDRKGKVYRMPYYFSSEWIKPEAI